MAKPKQTPQERVQAERAEEAAVEAPPVAKPTAEELLAAMERRLAAVESGIRTKLPGTI